MIRTVITPNQNVVHLSFTIPENYIGKEVEVIAFRTDEGVAGNASTERNVTFNALSLDTRNFKFNRDEANRR